MLAGLRVFCTCRMTQSVRSSCAWQATAQSCYVSASEPAPPGSGAAIVGRDAGNPPARAALANTMELRPASRARNIALPTRNISDTFLAASNAVIKTLIEIGLPPGTPR